MPLMKIGFALAFLAAFVWGGLPVLALGAFLVGMGAGWRRSGEVSKWTRK